MPRHQYVTFVEVGGAHSHKFYPLLEAFGIPTLIITDLDPVDNRKPKIRKCLVSESGRTSTQFIRACSPEMADITVAELLQRAETDPPIVGGSMCLAYQVPEEPGGPCGRIFEDAFALANRALFGISTGDAPVEELEQQARSSAETRRSKVDFALDHVLGDHDWQAPKYIRRGLEWLMAQDVVGDNPERIKSEAALAKLVGIAPVPTGSGVTSGRHRINHGGHRQLNAAIYRTIIVRMRFHQPTINYVTRRTAEGKTKREIIRCLKRYAIREVYHLIRPAQGPSPQRVDNYKSVCLAGPV
ncbi:transposase [Streptomyces brevispora]|uniref:transposase n=1 Tax=Streptomyces brevispora TaxID=887462 RepID=UPI003721E839